MKQKTKFFLNVLLTVILLAACGESVVTEPAGGTAATDEAASTVQVVVPTPDIVVDPNCNILWSRLQIGDDAYLTYGDRPNRVRSEPVRDSGNVIAQIYPGSVVTVVDGPVCADGYMFWRVEQPSIPGGFGWIAEGDGDQTHWVDPYNCASGMTSLYSGHYALVADGIQGLRVYDKQGSDGQVITQISAGMLVRVTGGPYCTGTDPNLVYWQVENAAIPGGIGWVAEYGFENDQYVRYLRYYWEADPQAFAQPATLASVTPKWRTTSALDLSSLEGSGQIAYVAEDWAWVIRADGTGGYGLKNPLGSYDTPSYLSWSPDGKNVVMVIGKKLYLLSTDPDELVAREIEAQQNTDVSDVVWSFDGEYVAFMSEYSIYAMKADGSDLHEVSVDHDWCTSPTWSPYGTYLAYICYEYGANLYISRVDAPGTSTFEAMGYIVSWSPDGQYLAYNDSEDGLSIVDATTGENAHTLVAEGSDTFAWSPDSKSIAFTYGDQVFQINITDGAISNLTGHTVEEPFNYVDGALSWSPDGRYIAFEFQTYSIDKKYWKVNPIYILDVNTGARAQLVEQGTLPVWSPVIEYPITQLEDCTNGWSQLRAGEQASVLGNRDTDPPNRVRAEGSKSAEQTGILYAGTVVDVLEGPVCSDGLVYWKVRGIIYPADVNSTVVPPDIGWTAEGDGTEYWLAPYQP